MVAKSISHHLKKNLVSDVSPVNTNKPWFPMASKCCRIFVHPRYQGLQRSNLSQLGGPWPPSESHSVRWRGIEARGGVEAPKVEFGFGHETSRVPTACQLRHFIRFPPPPTQAPSSPCRYKCDHGWAKSTSHQLRWMKPCKYWSVYQAVRSVAFGIHSTTHLPNG